MPKYLISVGLALACMAIAAAAQAAPIQTLDVKISPSKNLDKKKPKSVKLFVDIKTQTNSGALTNQDQPPNASKTVVDFPKNLKIDTDAVPRCKGSVDELQNTTTAQAIQICGRKSIISVPGQAKSSSHITADTNPAVADPNQTIGFPVVLTAFNGPGKRELIFHNRAEAVNNTTILDEKLKKKSKDPKYGTSLITNIPPILAGAPDDFRVTIKRNTIASAVCKQTTNPFQLTSTFLDYSEARTASSTTTTKCTRSKSKKGGGKKK